MYVNLFCIYEKPKSHIIVFLLKQPNQPNPIQMKKKNKILIVEDQLIIAYDIKQILESEGYDVVSSVSSVEDAIEVLRELPTDLALLDIGLKGNQTGLHLGELINQTFKIPFIYITSYSDAQTLKDASSTHPAGYIVKPFKPIDVLTAVSLAFLDSNTKQSLIEEFEAQKQQEQIPYRLKKVLQYIDEHLHEKIEVDDLALLTEWHKQHFIRTFVKFIHVTPYQYILNRKIEKSCEMIISSECPCSEIAFEFGFMSYGNFNKAFKKVKGYTPEQYRLKYK
jgi:YesN/AraC family two-component response regulator